MKNINVIEAEKLIRDKIDGNDFQIIDVRTIEEYKNSHIKNSKLLPLDEIEIWFKSLDKNKTYLLQCRSGKRSEIAQIFLISKGFKNTINLEGGILDWIENGFEVIII